MLYFLLCAKTRKRIRWKLIWIFPQFVQIKITCDLLLPQRILELSSSQPCSTECGIFLRPWQTNLIMKHQEWLLSNLCALATCIEPILDNKYLRLGNFKVALRLIMALRSILSNKRLTYKRSLGEFCYNRSLCLSNQETKYEFDISYNLNHVNFASSPSMVSVVNSIWKENPSIFRSAVNQLNNAVKEA